MSKVDWSRAPEGAEFYADGSFKKLKYKSASSEVLSHSVDGHWFESMISKHNCELLADYETCPHDWPDESRIDIISTNVNTGEGCVHYELNSTKTVKADEILSEGLQILTQRGEQYGSDGRECSFPEAATAFNAITGHNIKGSDVCLILALVKQVRQHAQPRYHHDSAVDAVNYLALQAELLASERK